MDAGKIIEKANLWFPSVENPDWGYARNTRSVLMVPSAEWVQSTFSCCITVNGKLMIAPNRDTPYEGLLVHNDGENWKFIDFVGLSIQDQGGRYLPIIASSESPSVFLNTWKVTYRYFVPGDLPEVRLSHDIPFYVTYSLNSKSPIGFATGFIELSYPEGLIFNDVILTPTLHPFLDIRHMYHDRTDLGLTPRRGRHQITISNYNRQIVFSFAGRSECNYYSETEFLDWTYKLGNCERTEVWNNLQNKSATIFRPKKKRIAAYFSLVQKDLTGQGPFCLFFSCGLTSNKPKNISFFSHCKYRENSIQADANDRMKIEDICGAVSDSKTREAVVARIAGLLKFKVNIPIDANKTKYAQLPHAGAWWFKTPWYRDVFEGYLNSFNTFLQFPGEKEEIKKTVLLALNSQERETGRIPNRLNEFHSKNNISYNISDGVILCYIVAHKLILTDNDISFAKEVLPFLDNLIKRFQQYDYTDTMIKDGAPRVNKRNGLLLSTPWHSWIDTRTMELAIDGHKFIGLPSRVSNEFSRDLYHYLGSNVNLGIFLSSPNFFLPEINAQWIILLRGALSVLTLAHDILPDDIVHPQLQRIVADLLYKAESNYKSVFYNPSNGFLYNLVYLPAGQLAPIVDRTECEAGVTAAAMLGETVFQKRELDAIWNRVEQTLLVYRRLSYLGQDMWPFGLLTRNINFGPYYGDGQYHADVCWPRSTPYLIQLLRILGKEQIIRQILLNNLDHQSTEAAIFYNQEVFSRPVGNNPNPQEIIKDNPVPVKNPIQFWSQWCDPYLDFMTKL